MGVDFIRRRNDRFLRQVDAHFVSQTQPDLLSACPPETVIEVNGTTGGIVTEGEELWASTTAAGPIELLRGDQPVVTLRDEAADHVRAKQVGHAGQIVATVTEVDSEHGIAVVRVGACS